MAKKLEFLKIFLATKPSLVPQELVYCVYLKGWSHEILLSFFKLNLKRYEGPKRAGSGLFLIVKRSSYLNFKKWWYCQCIRDESPHPGIVPRILILLASIRVNKLVIPGGIPFLWWIPHQ
jgi:hypothetical protein